MRNKEQIRTYDIVENLKKNGKKMAFFMHFRGV